MPQYQPINRAAFEALEEAYLLKEACHITFETGSGRTTRLDALITDLHEEVDGEYLTLNGTERIRLDNLVAVNGKPVVYFV